MKSMQNSSSFEESAQQNSLTMKGLENTGQEFREQADATINQRQQLTSMADEATIVNTPALPEFHKTIWDFSQTYNKQEIIGVLERQYLIGNYTWASTDAFDTKLIQLEFPYALFGITSLREKLYNFKMFRADVEIVVRTNATPQHQGAVMFAMVPCRKKENECFNSVVQACQNGGYVLSASTGLSCQFTIPWFCPLEWIDMGAASSFREHLIGSIVGYVLAPLASSNSATAAPITISVYANFKNVMLNGYIPRTVHPQGKTKVKKVRAKASKAIKEGDVKTERGTMAKVAHDVAAVAEIVSAVPIPLVKVVGEATHMVAKVAEEVFDFFGLEKPTSLEPYKRVVQTPAGDMSLGDGLETCHLLSLKTDAGMRKDVQFLTNWDGSLLQLIQRPGMVCSFAADSNDAINTRLCSVPVHPLTSWQYSYAIGPPVVSKWYLTPLAQVAQHFARSRGSIKFRIMFFCSKFVSARFRVSHLFTATAPSTYTSASGDYPSVIVDVKGDTIFDFTIPYVHQEYYIEHFANINSDTFFKEVTDYGTTLGYMHVSLDTLVTTSDNGITPVVNAVGFMAAGEDYVFSQLTGIKDTVVYAEGLVEDFQAPFPPLFPASYSMENRLVAPECYTSVADITHRYSAYVNWTSGVKNNIEITYMGTIGGLIMSMASMFAFWRGAIRLKAYFGDLPTTQNNIRYNLNYSSDTFGGPNDVYSTGAAVTTPSVNPYLTVEVPFYTTSPFLPTDTTDSVPFGPGNRNPRASVSGSNTSVHWWAGGDDFEFIYPIAVAPVTHTA